MTHDDDRTIPVAVIGAGGRMGSEACRAIEAATDLELVARLGREDSLQAVVDAGAAVAVDLTVPSATRDNVRFLVDHGIHRSEEHTSELQSRGHLVCRLLLEKKTQ